MRCRRKLVIWNNQHATGPQVATDWLFEVTNMQSCRRLVNLRSVACWLPARWLFHVGYQPCNQRAAPQITNMRGPLGVLTLIGCLHTAPATF